MFFFLLIHFLVVKDYELPNGTSHILSVPLNVEYFILIHLFFLLN